MKIDYDEVHDIAYIHFIETDNSFGVVSKTIDALDNSIFLDFDSDGMLWGIEILDATKVLPKGVIDAAERHREAIDKINPEEEWSPSYRDWEAIVKGSEVKNDEVRTARAEK